MDFILYFLYLASEFKDSISIFDQFSSCNCVEGGTLKLLQFFHFTETFLMSFTKIPILFQQLFMKKLMILSKSFVSLMSTTNFFFLRLDHFIPLLNTSSVIICLEFVFSNLRLTVSEDLLPLSVQESPNLFAFRVLSLNFVTLRVTCVAANNGFPRSIMTH